MRILFVCTGNTCRSPMCEAYFKKLCDEAGRDDIIVESAGTFGGDGCGASRNSVEVMAAHGIDLSEFKSSSLNRSRIKKADLIIALTAGHRMQILQILPEAVKKTRLLMEFSNQGAGDVADPYGGDRDLYMMCFEEMKKALDNLFLDLDRITDINNG